ncbi:zinc finger CCCH domain-containing protein 13-like isoform X2 [Cynara cardunculus var. scolymus]|uniref:zinc finger CCCH domain-containing protein 13-like isoform X2 n=1 Tax=Cynara cardunculus var. scolymus TaxID=59895 RepID=UPI000D629CE6|nr:zinc finger CCCH domain-containing protein 13-like isoform X2 [Cynara cardunculus var. scolymus]
MVGRKLFKTRICLLYRKGHCHRQTCSFAHGDAELRRYNSSSSSSFHGRREYRGADLRDKLGRQRSPPWRNSLDRDARDQLPSHGHNSPRLGRKSDWDHRKRQDFDGENDFSGNLRLSDGAERQTRERKPSFTEFKEVHDEQLMQVQSEIDMLEDHKQQLQIYLEERFQEADSLNSKIEELEMQLTVEKEEYKRISSKIRKFIKANNRHIRIQDELKRSQARLQKLGDQLGSDARAAANEEDISINILSDEDTLGNMIPKNDKVSPRKDEMLGNHLMGPQKDQYKSSPSKKRMRFHMVEADEKSKQASSTRERLGMGNMKSERHPRWDAYLDQTKNTDEARSEANGISNARPSVNDGKPLRRKSNFTSAPSGDKIKDHESTRTAVNIVDDVVEVVELNEKLEAEEVASDRVEGGSTLDNAALPFLLPPPPPPAVVQNAYLQYKGKDENVDVVDDDGDDLDDEMVDVDIG